MEWSIYPPSLVVNTDELQECFIRQSYPSATMPGVKGFSPINLRYMSKFFKLYAPLYRNIPQTAELFSDSLSDSNVPQVAEQSKKRQQPVDDFKMLFSIPWDHHRRIIDKCKDDMDKALFFARKTWENNSFYRSRIPQKLFFPILRKSHSNNINIWIFFQQNIYLIAESIRWIDNVQEILNYLSVKDTNSHSTYNN